MFVNIALSERHVHEMLDGDAVFVGYPAGAAEVVGMIEEAFLLMSIVIGVVPHHEVESLEIHVHVCSNMGVHRFKFVADGCIVRAVRGVDLATSIRDGFSYKCVLDAVFVKVESGVCQFVVIPQEVAILVQPSASQLCAYSFGTCVVVLWVALVGRHEIGRCVEGDVVENVNLLHLVDVKLLEVYLPVVTPGSAFLSCALARVEIHQVCIATEAADQMETVFLKSVDEIGYREIGIGHDVAG